MPRHNPSLVGAKLSHQSARTPRSQASKPTPRQARRPAPEPSNRRAHRNKFGTFYRGGHLRGGFQLRLRHPARKLLPARKLTRSNQRASRRARFPTCEASMRTGCSSRSLGPETASRRAGARATRARAAEALGNRGRDASGSGSASSKSCSSRTARRIPVDCFLENAAPDEDGSDGHHPQHGHDDADRARGAKGRRRKQQHCNCAANGTT